MPWARRASRSIPPSGSPTRSFEANDYSLGQNTFISNDKFPVKDGGANMFRLAQDARITTLGEYETRKGFDFHSAGAGETQDQAITSTTGAADGSFNSVTRLAQKWTCGTSGRLSKVELNLKSNSASGTIIVEHWTDSSGPSTLIARTSIDGNDVAASYGYITARFAQAPEVVATTSYWIVAYIQDTGSGSFMWSTNTSATTAMSSSDSGATWSSTNYALNFKQHYATDGLVKGLYRAYNTSGVGYTLFAHGTTLYTVNDGTGALTAIKTGLNASATHYRFVTVNNIVYYCNGFDGLRKWNFSTESQVNATNYTTLAVHKGLLFGARKDEPTRVDYSNFGAYETFTSTDFVYADSPKTGDPVTALVPLNGYLVMKTLNNCYILSGDDNATFSVDRAPDSKGTYSQETITYDKNFMYYLADDGVYRSNGSDSQLLSENIYQDIVTMANKDSACVALNKGRLYLWYRSTGVARNDSCFVFNMNFSGGSDTVESSDTDAFVSRAFNCFNDDDDLLVASSLVGQVYWQELSTNDYNNLGGDINYDLRTHYLTFSSPAVLKQIRNWLARFQSQSSSYTIKCDYAYDRRDNWSTLENKNVQGSGTTWGSGALWGAFTWGRTAEVSISTYVPDEYKRIAIRYYHHAARQPQKFLGHSFVAQVRRVR